MNVLVIPEDSRRDKDLLKPMVEALLKEAGRGRSRVRICEDPVLGGVGEALKWERIRTILDRYRSSVDLFLLIVDRDGAPNQGRRQVLNDLERKSLDLLEHQSRLLGEHAIEEVEVWVLAGLKLPAEWSWREVRTHPHPKEAYFQPMLETLRKSRPGRMLETMAREELARESAGNIKRCCSLCPEDLGNLLQRIRELS
jgi:hypothetical protein